MQNYDKMVKLNKCRNKEKESRAIAEIVEMQQAEEKVMVSELTKRTGLSRGFFYKNPSVRKVLDQAILSQQGKHFIDKRQVVLDKALEKKVNILEKQNEKQKSAIEQLEKEAARLKKQLNKKELDFIKKL